MGAAPIDALTTGNSKVIIITLNQLQIVAILTPLSGSISALYSQAIGPIDTEYPKQNK